MGRTSKILITLTALSPIIIWISVILYYSVNLPWYDDFDPFPDFLRKWIFEGSVEGRLKLLFQPNNEHRMVVGKFVTLAYYWITGHLNFTFLHIAGACFTLGTLLLFWKSFLTTKLSKWYFLPVPFLLFQLQYHLVFLWAICSLQHQPVVFFACLSMFLLSRNRPVWALIFGVCATYSMSNGIFVWPAGFVVLLLSARYRHLVLWCAVAVAAIGLYFYGMSAQGNEESFTFFAKYPHLSVLGFFAFLGGLFDFFPEKDIVSRTTLPVIMGFIFTIWVAVWLLRLFVSWLQQNFKLSLKVPRWLTAKEQAAPAQFQLFLAGIMTFLLVNAFIIGLLRPRFGFFVMVVSNYKLYPALFLTIAYLAFVATTSVVESRRRALIMGGLAAMFIWFMSALNYLPIIAERQKYLTVNGYNQEFNGYGLGHVPFSAGAAYVDTLMKEMVKLGVYEYPAKGRELGDKARRLRIAQPGIYETVRLEKDGVYLNDPDGRIFLSRNRGNYAFLRNADHTYIFKLEPHRYSGRNIFRQYDKGLSLLVPKSSLAAGNYEAGFMEVKNGDAIRSESLPVTIP